MAEVDRIGGHPMIRNLALHTWSMRIRIACASLAKGSAKPDNVPLMIDTDQAAHSHMIRTNSIVTSNTGKANKLTYNHGGMAEHHNHTVQVLG